MVRHEFIAGWVGLAQAQLNREQSDVLVGIIGAQQMPTHAARAEIAA